jgi:hypothetical protein
MKLPRMAQNGSWGRLGRVDGQSQGGSGFLDYCGQSWANLLSEGKLPPPSLTASFGVRLTTKLVEACATFSTVATELAFAGSTKAKSGSALGDNILRCLENN